MAKKLKQTYLEDMKWVEIYEAYEMDWESKWQCNLWLQVLQKESYQIVKYGYTISYFTQFPKHSSTWKSGKQKLEIERFFKKHVKCSKTVNEKNELKTKHLSPQLQSSNDSIIDLWSSKLKTESTSPMTLLKICTLHLKLFPDSAIASSFQLGPDKLKCLTNWGIVPYVK